MKRAPRMTPIYFYSLWAINGPMDRARLMGQLDEFQRLGLDGVVFHPRFYPGTPPYLGDDYLAILNDTILHAKSLGMRFWIYDENGWPSGTADGKLYANFPADTCQRLDLVAEPTGKTVASFEKEGRRWYLSVQDVRGIDCFNPNATRHFLQTIHERYRTGLSAEAFQYVEAFFTDEPESGVSWEPMPQVAAVPWSRHMPEYLRKQFGRDVTAELPLLFSDGEGSAEFRRGYWELVADQFARGFLDPYREWCEQHGKLFVGHVKGEEHPLFQIPMVGSCQQAYRHFSIPGIDALERYPTNHFYPRQASSVARQFGDGRCMVEANGGAGWGSSPEDFQRYLLWLGQQGLTDFVLHLSQYQLDSASLYDWPPSQPLHISWREAYPEILRHVRQEIAAVASIPRDTLVIAPYRRPMEVYDPRELSQTNIHNGADYPMSSAGRINREFMNLIESLHARNVAYDMTDERTFEECAWCEDGIVRLGRQKYTMLVSAPNQNMKVQASLEKATDRTVPSDPGVAAECPIREETSRVELRWSDVILTENAFLLEPAPLGKGKFAATFATPQPLPVDHDLSLIFPDDTADIEINEHPLGFSAGKNGGSATFAVSLLRPENTITFRSSTGSLVPFVWLTGQFLVRSRAPYVPGPHSTLRTKGPLELIPPARLAAKEEFVQAGLPFTFRPVEARVTVPILAPTRKLKFEFSSARPDALCLSDENGVLGWAWGPDWTLELDQALSASTHQFQMQCVPNGYNYYGPHHYYLGDGHVVSPEQIRGNRNFADPVDAPLKTHIKAFHFKPWALPSHLHLS